MTFSSKTLSRIFSLLVTVMWFVGANHCFFEPKFGAAHAGSQTSDCPSHSKGDPASHSEGRPCGGQTIASPFHSNQLAGDEFVLNSHPLLPVLAILASETGENTAFGQSFDPPVRNNVERLFSLTIASNAPPAFTAA